MNVCHYRESTGEYLQTTAAREDPLSPGNYLIPRNATAEPLPAVGTGQCAVFNGAVWQVKTDHRGEVIYNATTKEQKTQTEIGELEAGWQLGELPPDFAALRTQQKASLDAARINAENTEFVFVHNGANWDGGKTSKYRLQATLDGAAAIGGLPEGFYWTDADNQAHNGITLAALNALLIAMDAAMFIKGFEIHETKGALNAAIDAAPDDVAAITAIVWP